MGTVVFANVVYGAIGTIVGGALFTMASHVSHEHEIEQMCEAVANDHEARLSILDATLNDVTSYDN